MSLVRRWGFGALLTFDGAKAAASMAKSQRATTALRGSFESLRDVGSRVGSGLSTLATMIAPLGIGFGFAAAKASSLAGNLEAQKLTMRTLIGDIGQADKLLAMIRENAAATPFQEGDLIEGSKRLLRLTGDNIGANMDLLKVMETMAALNPGKNVVDAVEGVLDATSGGGFERLKEFGLSFRAEDFKKLGRPGGKAWADGVTEAIKQRMDDLTRGEDLVGALAKTFSGRVSTLQDAVSNLMKGIGEPLNKAIGPAIAEITTLINDAAPDIIEGFRLAFGEAKALWDRFGAPVFRAATAAWERMGKGGRQQLGRVVAILGALSMVLVPVAGGMAVLVTAGGAVAAILSAVVPLASAVVSAFTAMTSAVGAGLLAAAPTFLVLGAAAAVTVGVIMALQAAAASLVAGVVGTFRELISRSNLVTNLVPLFFDDMVSGIMATVGQLVVFGRSFASTFLEAFGPMVDVMITQLQPAFDELVVMVIDLMTQLGMMSTTTGDAVSAGQLLGNIAATVLIPALQLVELTVRGIIIGMKALLPVATQLVRMFRRLAIVVFGLADGSLSARDAMSLMLMTAEQGLLGAVRVVVSTVLGVLDLVLRQIQTLVESIPGLSNILGGVGVGRDSLSGLAGDIDKRLDEAIQGIDTRAGALERKRLEAASVTVTTPPVQVEAKIETTVCIEEQEIARAAGSAAVRSGERGKGPAMPATQRGRVLRNGLTVTPLRPSEVF